MDKYVHIKLTKMILLLTEQELISIIPTSLMRTALSRGKAYIRGKRAERYTEQHEKSRTDWEKEDVYGK